MMTRLIEDLGVFMGERRGINDEAFFFKNLNEWLLFQANTSWDDLSNYEYVDEFYINNMVRMIKDYMCSFKRVEYFGVRKYLRYPCISSFDTRLWGWKDPRNTITLNIWRHIFPAAKIIHVVRNPIDVAASLKKREIARKNIYRKNFKIRLRELLLIKERLYVDSYVVNNIENGIYLWEKYIEYALKANLYFKHVLHVKYEDLLQDPYSILSKICVFLNIEHIDDKVNLLSEKIDHSRRYSFLSDPELVEWYRKVKHRELLRKFEYSNIQ